MNKSCCGIFGQIFLDFSNLSNVILPACNTSDIFHKVYRFHCKHIQERRGGKLILPSFSRLRIRKIVQQSSWPKS